MVGFDTVLVPGGVLRMGSDLDEIELAVREWGDKLIRPEYENQFRSWLMKEYPLHHVQVETLMSWKYPVTNAQFRCFMANSDVTVPVPESIKLEMPDNHPVWGVDLLVANRFAEWLSIENGRQWRLPSEEEWEWMASGPNNLRYPFGNIFDSSLCNTIEGGVKKTNSVDKFLCGISWCGVFDLAGNVEEWTSSLYQAYPGGMAIEDDLANYLGKGYPILRGGSYLLGGDLARSSRRHGPHPGKDFRITGFRLVCSV